MNLPPCYRCHEQPCTCKAHLATLRRLILGELAERGRMNDEQLSDAMEEAYRRPGLYCPRLLVDEAIYSLVCGRRIRRTPGKWEGEYWYTVRPSSANRLRQEVLF